MFKEFLVEFNSQPTYIKGFFLQMSACVLGGAGNAGPSLRVNVARFQIPEFMGGV